MNFLFIQRINSWCVSDIIVQITRYVSNLIYNTSSVFGSNWWSTRDKYTFCNFRNFFHRFYYVIWIGIMNWKFIKATCVASTWFLREWDDKTIRAQKFRLDFVRSYVCRCDMQSLVRIWREIVHWRMCSLKYTDRFSNWKQELSRKMEFLFLYFYACFYCGVKRIISNSFYANWTSYFFICAMYGN